VQFFTPTFSTGTPVARLGTNASEVGALNMSDGKFGEGLAHHPLGGKKTAREKAEHQQIGEDGIAHASRDQRAEKLHMGQLPPRGISREPAASRVVAVTGLTG
jgi:hypothetical protein